jgi:DNA-directed RNA polymerase I subunit RPA1
MVSKVSTSEVRRLSDDTIKEMVASSGKKHLLPTEVCFLILKGKCKLCKQITKHFISQLLQVESVLKDLWKNEARFCMLLCDFQQNTLSVSEKRRGYEMFFLNSLLVAPNRFRPSTSSSLGVSISVIYLIEFRSDLTALHVCCCRLWNTHKMFC